MVERKSWHWPIGRLAFRKPMTPQAIFGSLDVVPIGPRAVEGSPATKREHQRHP